MKNMSKKFKNKVMTSVVQSSGQSRHFRNPATFPSNQIPLLFVGYSNPIIPLSKYCLSTQMLSGLLKNENMFIRGENY